MVKWEVRKADVTAALGILNALFVVFLRGVTIFAATTLLSYSIYLMFYSYQYAGYSYQTLSLIFTLLGFSFLSYPGFEFGFTGSVTKVALLISLVALSLITVFFPRLH